MKKKIKRITKEEKLITSLKEQLEQVRQASKTIDNLNKNWESKIEEVRKLIWGEEDDDYYGTVSSKRKHSWDDTLQEIVRIKSQLTTLEHIGDREYHTLLEENSKLWYLIRIKLGDPTLSTATDQEASNYYSPESMARSPFKKPKY